MQVPSNLYLNEIGKPAIYLPACMLVWGLISTCMAASQGFVGLLICRLALGFAEAAYFVCNIPLAFSLLISPFLFPSPSSNFYFSNAIPFAPNALVRNPNVYGCF